MKRTGANRIYGIGELPEAEQAAVRGRTDGIFHDAFIKDGDAAYGYSADGRAYLLDSADVEECARYRWFTDAEGHVVSPDVTPGRPVEMGAFLIFGKYREGGDADGRWQEGEGIRNED